MTQHFIPGSEGTCPTGKVRYPDEEKAAAALERVRGRRARRPDEFPPERIFYFCRHCQGWHLSSKPPDLKLSEVPKQDGETWEEYAHRLERRVKEQRELLAHVNEMRSDAGNRHERKRITHLTYALGEMAARFEEERRNKHALLRILREVAPERVERREPKIHVPEAVET